jgi:hypothetical protein
VIVHDTEMLTGNQLQCHSSTYFLQAIKKPELSTLLPLRPPCARMR